MKTDFLYVGRFKKDKGSIYLAELFKNILVEYNLKVVGTDKLNIQRNFIQKILIILIQFLMLMI